jgi:hypothetical protein
LIFVLSLAIIVSRSIKIAISNPVDSIRNE